jgi:hypothetical protein
VGLGDGELEEADGEETAEGEGEGEGVDSGRCSTGPGQPVANKTRATANGKTRIWARESYPMERRYRCSQLTAVRMMPIVLSTIMGIAGIGFLLAA